MTARTHEQFLLDLQERQPSIFSQYEIIGNYVSNHIKIKVKCRQCSTVTEKSPSKLLSGRGCNTCRQTGKLSILKKLSVSHVDYIFNDSDSYKSNDELNWICPSGHTGKTKVRKLIEGHKCRKCHHNSTKNDLSLVQDYLKSLPHIKLLSDEYVNCKTPLVFECDRHGIFYKTADKLLNRKQTCPICVRDNFKFYNLTIAERNKSVFTKIKTYLYLIDIEGVGTKVGISKNPELRFSRIASETGRVVDIICMAETDLYQAILLENEILNSYSRVDSEIVFAGYKEIISVEDKMVLVSIIEGQGTSGTGNSQSGGANSGLNADNKA